MRNKYLIKKGIVTIIIVMSSIITYAQSFTLSGTVVDEDNNPIELATVSCAEQGKVAMSNLKGEFEIKLN
mgnify:CR=1 FL=1